MAEIYFPRASYAFVGLAVVCVIFATWITTVYWIGPPWDALSGTGNIQYHDPQCFGFACWFGVVALACMGVFFLKHGPF